MERRELKLEFYLEKTVSMGAIFIFSIIHVTMITNTRLYLTLDLNAVRFPF